jgi:hypothetical protein
MARYRVLTGIDYPPNKRAEAGDIVEDLPAQSVKWLLDSGLIEDTAKPTKSDGVVKEEPKQENKVEATKTKITFKPNAKDGDKDGFVQDGTPFERPIGSDLPELEKDEK